MSARINYETSNPNKLIEPPENLSAEELFAWTDIYQMLVDGTSYRKRAADVELVRQYVQVKIMRDRAWVEWNKKPERYVRIVTGICSDGITPKVVIKENEHYSILKDCNKQLENLLIEFKLTPKTRLGGF
jgi:hypothetical protein